MTRAEPPPIDLPPDYVVIENDGSAAYRVRHISRGPYFYATIHEPLNQENAPMLNRHQRKAIKMVFTIVLGTAVMLGAIAIALIPSLQQ